VEFVTPGTGGKYFAVGRIRKMVRDFGRKRIQYKKPTSIEDRAEGLSLSVVWYNQVTHPQNNSRCKWEYRIGDTHMVSIEDVICRVQMERVPLSQSTTIKYVLANADHAFLQVRAGMLCLYACMDYI